MSIAKNVIRYMFFVLFFVLAIASRTKYIEGIEQLKYVGYIFFTGFFLLIMIIVFTTTDYLKKMRDFLPFFILHTYTTAKFTFALYTNGGSIDVIGPYLGGFVISVCLLIASIIAFENRKLQINFLILMILIQLIGVFANIIGRIGNLAESFDLSGVVEMLVNIRYFHYIYHIQGVSSSSTIEGGVIDNVYIIVGYIIGLAACFSLWRFTSKKTFLITLISFLLFACAISFKRIYIVVIPIIFYTFIKTEKPPFYYILLMIFMLMILLLIANSIFPIEMGSIWMERIMYFDDAIEDRVEIPYRVLKHILNYESFLVGSNDISFFFNRLAYSKNPFLEPHIAFFIYITGILGLALFGMVQYNWAKNLFTTYKTSSLTPLYLFSIYLFITVNITILTGSWVLVNAPFSLIMYGLGYYFSFARN